MKKTTLSVLMPNYNYGRFIGEALDAIVKQSLQPMEVLIIDDASTDNSLEIIDEYIKKYPFIRLFKNDKRMGASYNYRFLLGQAKGDYIYDTASDDKVLPGFFEKSMNLIAKYPNAGICWCNNIVQEKDEIIRNRYTLVKNASYFSPDKVVEIIRKKRIAIASNTVIIKRTALLEAGGYIPEFRWACDFFANIIASLRYGFCYIPETLTMMRMHSGQYGGKSSRKSKDEQQVIKYILDAFIRPECSDVLPLLKRADIFSSYPYVWDALMVIMKNNKYRGFLSLRLVILAIFEKIRSFLTPIVPSFVLRMYRRIFKNVNILRNE